MTTRKYNMIRSTIVEIKKAYQPSKDFPFRRTESTIVEIKKAYQPLTFYKGNENN